ncbi:hypothetical protein [Bradyrhizobium erythrophlei]|uniref:Secreted protein n=1 Tax=Bradyrhizobium erythrophlei TaxID=1437360 RepID=A0A1H5GEF8_9BRAD|nr:hypothetical protein [Bradyrhizobium erythrophlei]SEE14097.1 hypothetical protein SAMN05444164_7059 [Bradyrhizobium erythrophlei]
MKPLTLLCLAACLVFSASAALARGSMGSHMSTGGALGTSAASPGTNSLGTALSSSDVGGHPMKGPLLGTNPAIDQEDARLEKMLEGSICRGC